MENTAVHIFTINVRVVFSGHFWRKSVEEIQVGRSQVTKVEYFSYTIRKVRNTYTAVDAAMTRNDVRALL